MLHQILYNTMKKAIFDFFPSYRYFYLNEIDIFKLMLVNDFSSIIYFIIFYVNFLFL